MPAPRTGGGRKRGRLSRSGDFDRVYRQGRATGGREFVVHVFPREASLDAPRVGLSVSKKVGDAVTRNRIKRVVRASLDAIAGDLAAGSDLVVTARPDAVALDAREGQPGVERELRSLLGRTSAWAGEPATRPGGERGGRAADSAAPHSDPDAGGGAATGPGEA